MTETRLPPRRLRTLAPWLVAVLAGCAAGPDFERPAPPEVTAYGAISGAAYSAASGAASGAAAMPASTVSAPVAFGDAQRLETGEEVAAQWWRSLGAARLDAWVDQALAASPSLAAASATLRQAEELLAARAGSTVYPQVSASAGTQRQHFNPAAQGQAGSERTFSLHSAGIGVHYRLDLSGANRRALEALAARAEVRRHELEGARLELSAAVVAAAITRARLAAQIEATEALLQTGDDQLAVARERLRLGQATPDELLSLQLQSELTRAGLPALHKQRETSEHLLAALAGQPPGPVPDFRLDEFRLPTTLPLVLPAQLVRRRPDIQAAEALLQTAHAEYGVAVSRLYPQIDLSANLASQALSAGALFGAGSTAWSLLAQLTQPLFDAGLPAERRASLAALDAAAAHYRVVVLGALREVADALRALDHDARTLAVLAEADAAARALAASMERQHALGAASYVQLLVARQQAQHSRLGLVAAQAQRLADSAALYQAAGGGAAPAAAR